MTKTKNMPKNKSQLPHRSFMRNNSYLIFVILIYVGAKLAESIIYDAGWLPSPSLIDWLYGLYSILLFFMVFICGGLLLTLLLRMFIPHQMRCMTLPKLSLFAAVYVILMLSLGFQSRLFIQPEVYTSVEMPDGRIYTVVVLDTWGQGGRLHVYETSRNLFGYHRIHTDYNGWGSWVCMRSSCERSGNAYTTSNTPAVPVYDLTTEGTTLRIINQAVHQESAE